MDPIKKPTKAAIEAALSAYYAEVDEAARKNIPELWLLSREHLARNDHEPEALASRRHYPRRK